MEVSNASVALLDMDTITISHFLPIFMFSLIECAAVCCVLCAVCCVLCAVCCVLCATG